MDDSDLQTQITAARAYEQFFVPALFAQWAPRVAALANFEPGDRVLDVACGTGVLAREALSRVGPKGFICGLDASPGMLAVASELATNIEWRQGTAEALPYDNESFDVVVSQFALMFFNNKHRALTEMQRVLKENGRLVIAVWPSLETVPVYAAEVELLERLAGKPAADALTAPFVLGDADEFVKLMTNAGVKEVTITTQSGVARFPSIRFMVEADLRGWLPLMGVVLTEDQIEQILRDAEQVLPIYVNADASFEFGGHICTGTKG